MEKLYILSMLLLVICLSGCAVIGGIFKAGYIAAIISVILVVILVLWIASLFRGK